MFKAPTNRCLLALSVLLGGFLSPGLHACRAAEPEGAAGAPEAKGTIKVAACQAKRRSIDWRLKKPAEVLAAVDKNLDELEKIVNKAGEAGCDALALPEDTLGLLDWSGANEEGAKEILSEGVKRMVDRLGKAAAKHQMYLVVCSDLGQGDG